MRSLLREIAVRENQLMDQFLIYYYHYFLSIIICRDVQAVLMTALQNYIFEKRSRYQVRNGKETIQWDEENKELHELSDEKVSRFRSFSSVGFSLKKNSSNHIGTDKLTVRVVSFINLFKDLINCTDGTLRRSFFGPV